jgi:hypothetical protein
MALGGRSASRGGTPRGSGGRRMALWRSIVCIWRRSGHVNRQGAGWLAGTTTVGPPDPRAKSRHLGELRGLFGRRAATGGRKPATKASGSAARGGARRWLPPRPRHTEVAERQANRRGRQASRCTPPFATERCRASSRVRFWPSRRATPADGSPTAGSAFHVHENRFRTCTACPRRPTPLLDCRRVSPSVRRHQELTRLRQ